MRLLIILTILTFAFISCRRKTETTIAPTGVQLLIADTTNNRRAHWDLKDINFRSKLANQIGLPDLKNGVDSLEIRLWYDFSFSNSQELYILRLSDTSCILSYYRIYPRNINYDDENRNRNWDPYSDPIVDSSISKSVLISKEDYQKLHSDSIWFLKSQSELKIPENIGFTDCDSYILEIADKRRFKYLRHHCAMSYYEKTKLPEILNYLDFCERITFLTRKYNAIVPYYHN